MVDVKEFQSIRVHSAYMKHRRCIAIVDHTNDIEAVFFQLLDDLLNPYSLSRPRSSLIILVPTTFQQMFCEKNITSVPVDANNGSFSAAKPTA